MYFFVLAQPILTEPFEKSIKTQCRAPLAPAHSFKVKEITYQK
jgi:hypothetical protein